MPYSNIEQQREYQRKWIAARRAKWFSTKSCIVCGLTIDLELDHIDPKTKVAHSIWSWSWARIEEETAKCQVLCKLHHAEKTVKVDIPNRIGPIYQHGRLSTYFRGCRCNQCTLANTMKMRAQRAK